MSNVIPEYDPNTDNYIDIIKSCKYFNNYIYSIYNDSYYKTHYNYTYDNFIIDLTDYDYELRSLVYDNVKKYPLIKDFYVIKSKKLNYNYDLYDFIIGDVPLIHMNWFDKYVRYKKLNNLINLTI